MGHALAQSGLQRLIGVVLHKRAAPTILKGAVLRKCGQHLGNG